MGAPLPDPASLDWAFCRECPRCGEDSGWNGFTDVLGSQTGLELACPNCGHRFSVFSGKWTQEFARQGLPTFTPGRGRSG
jgi:DNA-directed RNA polymerase subunit RPC12/RpoP